MLSPSSPPQQQPPLLRRHPRHSQPCAIACQFRIALAHMECSRCGWGFRDDTVRLKMLDVFALCKSRDVNATILTLIKQLQPMMSALVPIYLPSSYDDEATATAAEPSAAASTTTTMDAIMTDGGTGDGGGGGADDDAKSQPQPRRRPFRWFTTPHLLESIVNWRWSSYDTVTVIRALHDQLGYAFSESLIDAEPSVWYPLISAINAREQQRTTVSDSNALDDLKPLLRYFLEQAIPFGSGHYHYSTRPQCNTILDRCVSPIMVEWLCAHGAQPNEDDTRSAMHRTTWTEKTVALRDDEKRWRTHELTIGSYVNAIDITERWRACVVVDVKENQVKLHYGGWKSRWDEWEDRMSLRLLAPFDPYDSFTDMMHPSTTSGATTEQPSSPPHGHQQQRRRYVVHTTSIYNSKHEKIVTTTPYQRAVATNESLADAMLRGHKQWWPKHTLWYEIVTHETQLLKVLVDIIYGYHSSMIWALNKSTTSG